MKFKNPVKTGFTFVRRTVPCKEIELLYDSGIQKRINLSKTSFEITKIPSFLVSKKQKGTSF